MKCIEIKELSNGTKFTLREVSLWSGSLKKVNSFQTNFNINKLPDRTQCSELNIRCIALFQKYIRSRLTFGWFFHNRDLTFKKIRCAVQGIEICLKNSPNSTQTRDICNLS